MSPYYRRVANIWCLVSYDEGLWNPQNRDPSVLSFTALCKIRAFGDPDEGGYCAARRLVVKCGGAHLMEQPTPEHLEAQEEIERDGLPGLVKMLREEGLEEARFVLWDLAGWHRGFTSP